MGWNQTREQARASLMKYSKGRYTHMLELDDEFPTLGMFEPECVSAEVGPGWRQLLRPVLQVLSKYDCSIDQIKSKFCVLTVYWHRIEDGKIPLSTEEMAEITTTLKTCVDISTRSCEDCGTYVAKNAGELMGGRRQCPRCEADRSLW
jgi:hypothetical protein